MRYIDMKTWPRSEHFEMFQAFDHPHFSMCANVDVSAFFPLVKKGAYSLTIAVVYLLSRAANAITEFRYRIRPEGVVEHEIVHPSYTLLTHGDLFSFCYVDYCENFSEFVKRAKKSVTAVGAHPTLKNEPGRDDFLFMTALPWVSFTSFMHPIHLQPPDCVPRFAWGKIFEDGKTLKMPLSVQAHHALMDGVHMARYYEAVQEYLNNPRQIFGERLVEQ